MCRYLPGVVGRLPTDVSATVSHVQCLTHWCNSYRVDGRKRRDRTERAYHHWTPQFDGMVDAYMSWCLNEEQGSPVPEEIDGVTSISVTVVDAFGEVVPWTIGLLTTVADGFP